MNKNKNDNKKDEQVALDLQAQEDLQFALDLQAQDWHNNRTATTAIQTTATTTPSDHYPHASSMLPPETPHMLFVPCEMDGKFVQMFVDSGASNSAISSCMVQQLGLQHKVNPCVKGSALGAGSAQILGLLEQVACTIGHVEFRMCFLVLDTPRPLLLLGLDQLRRFKCVVDLEENTLTFGGKNGVSVEFLAPDVAEEASAAAFAVSTTAGARSRGGGWRMPRIGRFLGGR